MNQKGLAPIAIIILLVVVGVVSVTAFKAKNNNQSSLSSNPSPSATSSAQVNNSPSSTLTPKIKATFTPTPSSSAKPTTQPSISPTPTPTSSSTSNSSTPTPTPTTSPTPTSTPSLKTYTWSGNNINVTTKCSTGDSTFDIEMKGDVIAGQGNGVWTTLTGNGRTIIVSYDQGNSSSQSHIAFNFNDQVTSIRAEPSITLQTSIGTTYGYEIKAYGAPYTDAIPSFSNQIGNVSFATDCK